ncbi:hypothetical protein SDC9_183703 [bioreactor metagenome]|uniref:Uncharacterized protein n=1 Tax=bioreactor metagenome TaxID=1076179 RepID=A0A645HAY9_9ZZZZ
MEKSAAYFKQLAQTTDNADLSRDINTIGAFADKLIEASESDESKLRGVRKFLNYYLPVLYKLIMKYTEIEGMRLTSADSAEIRTKITEAVHKTAEAFEVKLNTLYEGEILDIDSEISVLETMLAKDGLTVNKDFEQVLNKKDGIKEDLPGTDGERKSMTLILDEVNASVDKIDELIAKVK